MHQQQQQQQQQTVHQTILTAIVKLFCIRFNQEHVKSEMTSGIK
jgi:hypothetical protein